MEKKNLKTEYPQIAKERHPSKNGSLTADMVTPGSGKKVWWLCSQCGSEWEAAVYNRTRGNGCPYCSGRNVIQGRTDLQTLRPDLAAEWHPTLNRELTPQDVSPNSHKKIWWECSVCGNEWQSSPNSRSQGHGCPVCSQRKEKREFKSLAKTYPNVAAEWHPTLNNVISPKRISPSSRKKYWWLCKVCGGEWQASPAKRTKGTGCPFCSGRKVIPGKTDLQTLRPDIAKEWDQNKNKLQPSKVGANSAEKVFWICPKGHSYQAAVFSRTRGTGCPYCAGKKILQGFNDLATLFPGIASEWHPTKNGDLTAADVTAHSNKRVWWFCNKCGKEWQTTVSTRTYSGKDRGCQCRGSKKNYIDKVVDEKKIRELFKPKEEQKP